jgi:ATP-dependent Clp protease ATP-binding subunit ClpC
MDTTSYSQKIREVLVFSRDEAIRLGNNFIGPEHLLLGLLREKESLAVDILKNLLVDLKYVKETIDEKLRTDEVVPLSKEIPLIKSAEKILKLMTLESRLYRSQTQEPEHLLLAIMKDNSNLAAQVLLQENVTYRSVQNLLREKQLNQTPQGNFVDDADAKDESGQSPMRPQGTENNAPSSSSTPVLDNFGTNLTQAAENGCLDPVVGRDDEIQRVCQILSRRKKNNPVLIGEPGVGKSSIVEGLAQRIVDKKVSHVLFNKKVFSLDMASVVAGTKYRGQFEERIKSIINELKKNPNIILFIDEIHTIVGAGSSPGSLDAANILKPALARGDIQCIGATTLNEYRQHIEKDGALERRFQKVIVDPTTAEETLQILRNIKKRYEEHHFVQYTDEALQACVKYTERYISDRAFPDKAIDALDEAGAHTHISNVSLPSYIVDLEKQKAEAKELKEKAVSDQDFELAANYRDEEKQLAQKIAEERSAWEGQLKKDLKTVDEEEIRKVVSMMSGVPIQNIAQAENEKLLNMKDELLGKVIGQDEAVVKIVKSIQRSRIGLKDPNRPIGSFIFVGPTGVGKTYLAKMLAKEMFGSTDALIRIDMSEYMEKFSVSRLIGAPPGYVGYEEGGQLTERVRRKPYSIVLLDELEKAHADVFNLLLQVLDEGRLTDSLGRQVDFRNTVIIMTSNAGTRQLKDFGKGIGFSSSNPIEDKQFGQSVIMKALNKTFSPEFLNRIDDIIMFDQLPKEAIFKIIDLELEGVFERTEKMGYKLQISDEAKNFIAEQGYDIQFGARPLKRSVQKYVEDEVAEQLLNQTAQQGDILLIDYDSDNKKTICKTIKGNDENI